MSMNMADQVRKAIVNCGLTQYAIAKQTGISKGGLSRFTRGERDMNLRTLDKLVPVIGMRLVIDRPKRRKKGR